MSTADVNSSDTPTLRSIIGECPTSNKLSRFLRILAQSVDGSAGEDELLEPDIKCYPDCLYLNYYSIGMSLMFTAVDGSKSIKEEDMKSDKLRLDSICLYNAQDTQPNTMGSRRTYTTYPSLPVTIPLLDTSKDRTAKELVLSSTTTGKDIVSLLGEPARKGGGSGPSSGSIGIWCEWTKDGIMVEFGGDEARGPKAWETGKNARWNILTLFEPS